MSRTRQPLGIELIAAQQVRPLVLGRERVGNTTSPDARNAHTGTCERFDDCVVDARGTRRLFSK